MEFLLRGGRVVDPSTELDGDRDVRIAGGEVVEIGKGLVAGSAKEVDVSGCLVTPGLVDLHVHFREPGQEYKEDIASGARAAAAGGFTTVCAMPNTQPVNDKASITEFMVRRSREAGLCRVHPVGALTRGLNGEELADYADMQEAGAVALSDDGRPVMDAGLMRRALEYAKTFDMTVVQHAEDLGLSCGGVMNEGEVSTKLGLRGQPAASETVMVARDIELVSWTGARYHVAHASADNTFSMVADARKKGLPVTCEVTPHHFSLTDAACEGYDTAAKVAPPLRERTHVEAVKQALSDGIADCIATDHAPHSAVEKDTDFDTAAFGMLGLETCVPLSLALVEEGVITLPQMVALLTWKPAKVFGLDAGTLVVGKPADICVIDPGVAWTVDRDKMHSKSKNTPFHGQAVRGRAKLTLLAGKPVHDPEELCK